MKKILIALLLIFTSCTKHEEPEPPAKMIQMQESANDILIPEKVWDMVTGSEFGHAPESAAILFVPLKVTLKEKTRGVLIEPRIEIELSNGGGEIDLSKYVKDQRGTFHVYFDFPGMNEENLQIYYISQGRKRKIDDRIIGSGCRSFFDIKKYILKTRATEGLVVNTTRDRHVSVLAGHFVFSYKKSHETYITRVTFADSKRPQLFCHEEKSTLEKKDDRG